MSVRPKKWMVAMFVAALCVGAVAAARFSATGKAGVHLDKRLAARSKGKPGAPLWIVEYVDYQCKSCRRASEILEDVMKRHPDDIFLQVRFHPMRNHRHGFQSALYAECAAKQNKFFPMHDELMRTQPEWADEEDATGDLQEAARRAGLNMSRLDACVKSTRTEDRVLKEREDSELIGVSATPSFFLNGKMLVGFQALENALSEYFKEKIS